MLYIKKSLFVLFIAGILLTMSCDVENDPEKLPYMEVTYFTIKYHGNGHTSGEPPVDPNKYKPVKIVWEDGADR